MTGGTMAEFPGHHSQQVFGMGAEDSPSVREATSCWRGRCVSESTDQISAEGDSTAKTQQGLSSANASATY